MGKVGVMAVLLLLALLSFIKGRGLCDTSACPVTSLRMILKTYVKIDSLKWKAQFPSDQLTLSQICDVPNSNLIFGFLSELKGLIIVKMG